MDCSEIRRFTHAYIDNEFDERDQLEFELHLSQCPSCREEINYYRSLRRMLKKKLPSRVAPLHLESMIRSTLDQEVRIQRGWFSLSMATVGAFVLALGTFLWSSNVDERIARRSQPTPLYSVQPASQKRHPTSVASASQRVPQDPQGHPLNSQQKRYMKQLIHAARRLEQRTAQRSPHTQDHSTEPSTGSIQHASDTNGTKPTIALRNCDLEALRSNAPQHQINEQYAQCVMEQHSHPQHHRQPQPSRPHQSTPTVTPASYPSQP